MTVTLNSVQTTTQQVGLETQPGDAPQTHSVSSESTEAAIAVGRDEAAQIAEGARQPQGPSEKNAVADAPSLTLEAPWARSQAAIRENAKELIDRFAAGARAHRSVRRGSLRMAMQRILPSSTTRFAWCTHTSGMPRVPAASRPNRVRPTPRCSSARETARPPSTSPRTSRLFGSEPTDSALPPNQRQPCIRRRSFRRALRILTVRRSF